MIDRRRFLINAAIVATGTLMPTVTVKANTVDINALERITAVINENIALTGCTPMSADDLDALAYAYKTIKPENHVEHAVAVACSRSHVFENGIIDEYARRKRGEDPEFFTHPVLHLKKLGVPDTQGLFIFREQVDWFLAEIISDKDAFNVNDGVLLRKKIGMGTLHFEELYNHIHPKYREQMSAQELYELFHLLNDYTWCGVYLWCSAMAARAGL